METCRPIFTRPLPGNMLDFIPKPEYGTLAANVGRAIRNLRGSFPVGRGAQSWGKNQNPAAAAETAGGVAGTSRRSRQQGGTTEPSLAQRKFWRFRPGGQHCNRKAAERFRGLG